MSGIRLCGDAILVDVEPIPEKRGILYSVEDKSVFIAKVVAVGPGKWSKNGRNRIPMPVSVGDRIAFHRWHKELKQGRMLSAFFDSYYPRADETPAQIALIRPTDVMFLVEGDHVVDT